MGYHQPFLSMLDNDKITILSDQLYKVPASHISGIPQSVIYDIDCPLVNFPFKYDGTSSNYSSVNKNLYLVFVPYTPQGAIGDSSVCTIDYSTAVTYSDSR
jgi:hypothetical protein